MHWFFRPNDLGGIGLFLIFTGIEVTADITPIISLNYLYQVFQLRAFKLWGTSFGAAMLLKFVQRCIPHPLLVPAFYTIVPIIFYVIVFSTGTSFDALREMGNTFFLT
jgi:sulfate permease, SulP family